MLGTVTLDNPCYKSALQARSSSKRRIHGPLPVGFIWTVADVFDVSVLCDIQVFVVLVHAGLVVQSNKIKTSKAYTLTTNITEQIPPSCLDTFLIKVLGISY